ncbi:hypothetical protein Sste5346_002435 [Sporothrix stenoceras]|uniref:D-xylose 1-dehydrogenase (NADP(+), D-xylono-1,5-lactone-forming) n=1 Tax=Sporothrix stenoceras TaxID=5173 RepID=A0ABR3ZIJ4_9PEZI
MSTASSTPFTCRWALLGLSSIAVTFVEDLLLPRNDSDPIRHEIACVSTTGTIDRARRWLEDRKVPNADSVQVFSSSDEMLATGQFDVVYISTPHPLHYQAARTALHHQRSVLVEKPATMNRAQFLQLASEAKAQKGGVVLMEAMWTRYLPAIQFLQKDLLPRIGTVKRVFSDLSVPIMDAQSVATPEMASSRLVDKQAGAGAMLDMGVYALTWADIALGGTDNTKVVYADSIPLPTGTALIDDINTVLLKNGEGVAIITTSLSLAGSSHAKDKLAVEKVGPAVKIEGTKAQVSVPFPLIRPQELQIEWYGEAEDVKKETVSLPVERGWGLWYQADVMAKAIQAQRATSQKEVSGAVIGEAESARVLGWMDAARKAANIAYDAEAEAV